MCKMVDDRILLLRSTQRMKKFLLNTLVDLLINPFSSVNENSLYIYEICVLISSKAPSPTLEKPSVHTITWEPGAYPARPIAAKTAGPRAVAWSPLNSDNFYSKFIIVSLIGTCKWVADAYSPVC